MRKEGPVTSVLLSLSLTTVGWAQLGPNPHTPSRAGRAYQRQAQLGHFPLLPTSVPVAGLAESRQTLPGPAHHQFQVGCFGPSQIYYFCFSQDHALWVLPPVVFSCLLPFSTDKIWASGMERLTRPSHRKKSHCPTAILNVSANGHSNVQCQELT